MIRFGLCCIFEDGYPSTRGTTIKKQKSLPRRERARRLLGMIHDNVSFYIPQAIYRCADLGIHSFRVSANVFPCMTHHEEGFPFEMIPSETLACMTYCKALSQTLNVRLVFHHNHFIVPGSDNIDIAERSLYEITEMSKFCWRTGIDTMILHCSGKGDKHEMLDRLISRINTLSPKIKSYIGFENDHNKCSPQDAYYVAKNTGCRFIYDVHHHRLNTSGETVQQATDWCEETALTNGIEPLFHLSSPRNGWGGGREMAHSDFIDINDFPQEWRIYHLNPDRHATIEIETKMRESALSNIITHFSKDISQ